MISYTLVQCKRKRQERPACLRYRHERRPQRPSTHREAALRLFAANGIAATSIRAVAEEAGVSPGLIVHHFESKDGLCRAVDEAALDRIERAVASVPASERVGDRVEQQTQEIAIVIRDAPLLADYIGRALVERGTAGVALFERMAERARGGLQAAARAGNLQPGVDRRWAPLQLILLLFGPFLLRPLLEQDLGESLLSEGALERWMRANADLLRNGLYR